MQIQRLRPIKFEAKLLGEHKGGNFLSSDHSTNIIPLRVEEIQDAAYAIIQLTNKWESIEYDFNFRINLDIPFFLKPKQNITIEDLYNCIQQSEEHLQHIINEIYYEKTLLLFAKMEFDTENKMFLSEKLAQIQAL